MEDLAGISSLTLPRMKGTRKQVLWARSIRGLHLFRFKAELAGIDRRRVNLGLAPIAAEIGGAAISIALGEARARWWIDHDKDKSSVKDLLSADELNRLCAAEAEVVETIRLRLPGPDCPF